MNTNDAKLVQLIAKIDLFQFEWHNYYEPRLDDKEMIAESRVLMKYMDNFRAKLIDGIENGGFI